MSKKILTLSLLMALLFISEGLSQSLPQISHATKDWSAPDWTGRWYPGNNGQLHVNAQQNSTATVNAAGKFLIANGANETRSVTAKITISKWNPTATKTVTDPTTGQVTMIIGLYEFVGETDSVAHLLTGSSVVIDEEAFGQGHDTFTVGKKGLNLKKGEYEATLKIASYSVDPVTLQAVGQPKAVVVEKHHFSISPNYVWITIPNGLFLN